MIATIKAISKYLSGEVEIGIVKPNTYKRVLVLLHGCRSSFDDMRDKLPLTEYAEAHQIIIVIPNMNDGYYIDREGYLVGKFITEELFHILKMEYVLTEEMEVYLAGISMGGYGSLLIGLRYPDVFRGIAAISGSFIAHDVIIGNPEVVGSAYNPSTVHYFLNTFGPLCDLEQSVERNPEAAIRHWNKESTFPPLVLTCGTEDLLYTRNQNIINLLKNKELPFLWKEIPDGLHDWTCFDKGMRFLFDAL